MTAGPPDWLVLIDLQRVFAEPDSPWVTPDFASAADACRRLGTAYAGRTVLTRFLPHQQPTAAWMDYYAQWPFARDPANAARFHLVEPWADTDAPVVSAARFGKWGSELAAIVGDAPLVVAGVSTDCCVLSTVLAAVDDGRRLRVVVDACAGLDNDSHRRALDVMALYAPHVTLTTVAAELAG